MEKKKEYAVSYYGGHVTAWLCVAAAILGIMYLLLGRGGGTKSMMVALFFTLVLGLVLAKDRKAYGEEMLAGLRESMFCVICVAFFMAGLLSSLLKTSGLIQALIWVVAELHVNPRGGIFDLRGDLYCLRDLHRYCDCRFCGDVSSGGGAGYRYGPDVRRGGQRFDFWGQPRTYL